ncbi:MAG: histidine phosphatase family protein [Xanthomonadales bacterium]|nr:histidine phosphatase family protein [Xanthomonadales bacterium]
MKTVNLIRHAKSSWEDSRLSDVNRPLAPRGIKDCKIMAGHILEAGWNPVNVFCSRAQRAQLTIRGIAKALPYRDINWLIDDALYTFSYGSLINWLEQLDDEISEVTLVGHNPAFTDLVNHLSKARLDNVSTCAYVQMVSSAHVWAELLSSQTEMVHFVKPKMFK